MVRSHLAIFTVLLLSLTQAGCKLKVIGSSGSAAAPTALDVRSPYFDVSAQVDATGRDVTLTSLMPGRPHSFWLYEGGQPAVDLACSALPPESAVQGHTLHFHLGIRHSPGVEIIRCTTRSGPLTLRVPYPAWRFDLLSTSIQNIQRGARSVSSAVLSRDGKWAAWVEGGHSLTQSTAHVMVEELSSGQIRIASSPSGGFAALSGMSAQAVSLSGDGRYAVMYLFGSGLIAGVSGSQIYRKDMSSGLLELVSSTDGSAANQGNAASSTPQASADGRYVVFTSTATNLVAGTTGYQVFRKDMQTGAIVLVSSVDGTAANQASASVALNDTSADGRWVTFSTSAPNLFPGASGTQIYRKDLQTGALALVSSTDGTAANQGNSFSSNSKISPDGRYVAFASLATNLVPGTTLMQIFVRDMNGASVVLASSTDGTAANRANNTALAPFLSDDARYVAFSTTATNLVPGMSGAQVVRKNLQSGAIELVSSTDGSVANEATSASLLGLSGDGMTAFLSADSLSLVGESQTGLLVKNLSSQRYGQAGKYDGRVADMGSSGYPNLSSRNNAVSADGNRIVFTVQPTGNLFPGTLGYQVYVRDRAQKRLLLASSVDGTGATASDSTSVADAGISSDGRYVAFAATATNLVAGATGAQIYRKNLDTGTIDLVSSLDGTSTTQGNGSSTGPSLSGDGRYVMFTSIATNLVVGTTGNQVFRKDMQTGAIALVSSTDGTAANRGNNAVNTGQQISSDGRYVLFSTPSTNLVSGTSGTQLFLKDVQGGAISLVSSKDGTAANQGNADSTPGAMTPDSRYVVFYTSSTNLVAGASGQQIYRKDLQTGTIDLVSSLDGTAATRGDASSSSPIIGADPRYVLFTSNATNLVAGANAGATPLYRKDLTTGAVELLTTPDGNPANAGMAWAPNLSADGHLVALYIYVNGPLLLPPLVHQLAILEL